MSNFSKSILWVCLGICICSVSVLELKPGNTQTGLHLFGQQDSLWCSNETVLPVESGVWRMDCEYIDPQLMKISIQGLNGSNWLKDRYLMAWQNSEIAPVKDTVRATRVLSKRNSFTISFDRINMDPQKDYVIALGTTRRLSSEGASFPVAAYFPAPSDSSKRAGGTSKTGSAIKITARSISDSSLECTYWVPNGNQPRRAGHYIILFRGGMSANYYNMDHRDLVAYAPVRSNVSGANLSFKLPLPASLQYQEKYTVAYVAGAVNVSLPNLRALVAWSEFIAN